MGGCVVGAPRGYSVLTCAPGCSWCSHVLPVVVDAHMWSQVVVGAQMCLKVVGCPNMWSHMVVGARRFLKMVAGAHRRL